MSSYTGSIFSSVHCKMNGKVFHLKWFSTCVCDELRIFLVLTIVHLKHFTNSFILFLFHFHPKALKNKVAWPYGKWISNWNGLTKKIWKILIMHSSKVRKTGYNFLRRYKKKCHSYVSGSINAWIYEIYYYNLHSVDASFEYYLRIRIEQCRKEKPLYLERE